MMETPDDIKKGLGYASLTDDALAAKAGLAEQYRWERDVAIAQLEQLGIGLGEKVECKVPKWISVEERLPEEFHSVIVHMPQETPCPTVHEGYRTNDGRWYAAHFVREFDEVTHWMPLPEPPVEE